MSDRKYRHSGYQDDGPKRERTGPTLRKPAEPIDPRIPRDPKPPNMPGFREVFRCAACGNLEETSVGTASQCQKCSVDLHACVQCAYFDGGARFECMQPISARVTPKDTANDCRHYAPRVKVERETGSTPAPAAGAPSSARKAFDDLFKF